MSRLTKTVYLILGCISIAPLSAHTDSSSFFTGIGSTLTSQDTNFWLRAGTCATAATLFGIYHYRNKKRPVITAHISTTPLTQSSPLLPILSCFSAYSSIASPLQSQQPDCNTSHTRDNVLQEKYNAKRPSAPSPPHNSSATEKDNPYVIRPQQTRQQHSQSMPPLSSFSHPLSGFTAQPEAPPKTTKIIGNYFPLPGANQDDPWDFEVVGNPVETELHCNQKCPGIKEHEAALHLFYAINYYRTKQHNSFKPTKEQADLYISLENGTISWSAAADRGAKLVTKLKKGVSVPTTRNDISHLIAYFYRAGCFSRGTVLEEMAFIIPNGKALYDWLCAIDSPGCPQEKRQLHERLSSHVSHWGAQHYGLDMINQARPLYATLLPAQKRTLDIAYNQETQELFIKPENWGLKGLIPLAAHALEYALSLATKIPWLQKALYLTADAHATYAKERVPLFWLTTFGILIDQIAATNTEKKMYFEEAKKGGIKYMHDTTYTLLNKTTSTNPHHQGCNGTNQNFAVSYPCQRRLLGKFFDTLRSLHDHCNRRIGNEIIIHDFIDNCCQCTPVKPQRTKAKL